MRRISIACACLLAALAVGATATASASAAPPEFGRCIKKAKAEGEGFSNGSCTNAVSSGAKYEWAPGPGPDHGFTTIARYVFSGKYKNCLAARSEEEIAEEDERKREEAEKNGEPEAAKKYKHEAEEHFANATADRNKAKLSKEECETLIETEKAKAPAELETVTGLKVTCGGVSSVGEYTGPKTLDVTTRFTECVTSFFDLTCTSPGAEEGEVATSLLDGEVGVVKTEVKGEETKVKPGIDLFAASEGGAIAEFTCGSGVFKTNVTVTGSVIHEVKANSMLLEETETFSQTKGKQKPESFEGMAPDVLETSLGGGEPTQSGQTLRTTLVNEEKMEVNTVA